MHVMQYSNTCDKAMGFYATCLYVCMCMFTRIHIRLYHIHIHTPIHIHTRILYTYTCIAIDYLCELTCILVTELTLLHILTFTLILALSFVLLFMLVPICSHTYPLPRKHAPTPPGHGDPDAGKLGTAGALRWEGGRASCRLGLLPEQELQAAQRRSYLYTLGPKGGIVDILGALGLCC